MTEETKNAAMSGSIGIIMAIGVSALLGWFLILGLLFSIQDLDRTLNSETGQPVAQILLDSVGVDGAIILMVSDPFGDHLYYAITVTVLSKGHHHRSHVLLWHIFRDI